MNIPGLEHDVTVGRPDGDLDWRAMTPDAEGEGEGYSEDGTLEQSQGYLALGLDLDAIFAHHERDTKSNWQLLAESWNEEDHPRGHEGNPGQFAHKLYATIRGVKHEVQRGQDGWEFRKPGKQFWIKSSPETARDIERQLPAEPEVEDELVEPSEQEETGHSVAVPLPPDTPAAKIPTPLRHDHTIPIDEKHPTILEGHAVPTMQPQILGRPGQPMVVSCGVGRDSVAMLVRMKNLGIRPDAVLFANVGSEKKETYEYIPILRKWLKKVGFPELTVVRYEPDRAPYRSLEGNLILNATFPGATIGKGNCTMKFKVEPQNKWVKNWPEARLAWQKGEKVLRLIGFEADEEGRLKRADAKAHAGKIRSEAKKKGRKNKDGIPDEAKRYEFRYPLMEWGMTLDDCIHEIQHDPDMLAVVKEMGLPPERAVPVKSACYFCPNQKEAEVDALTDDDRARIILMELAAEPYIRDRKKLKGLWRRPTKKSGKPGSITEYILAKGLTFTPLEKICKRIVGNPYADKFKKGHEKYQEARLDNPLRELLIQHGHHPPEFVIGDDNHEPGIYLEDVREVPKEVEYAIDDFEGVYGGCGGCTDANFISEESVLSALHVPHRVVVVPPSAGKAVETLRVWYESEGVESGRTVFEAWDELDHPRGHEGNRGQFAHKDGPRDTRDRQEAETPDAPTESPPATPMPFKVRGKGDWEWDGRPPDVRGPMGGTPHYRVKRLSDGATGELMDFGTAGWRIHLDNEHGWRYAAQGKGSNPLSAKLDAQAKQEKIAAVGTEQGREEGLRRANLLMEVALASVQMTHDQKDFPDQLSPEDQVTLDLTKQIVGDAYREVISRFGPKALEHIGQLDGITVFKDQPTLAAMMKAEGDYDSDTVQGVYRHSKTSGSLELAGVGTKDPVGTLAHEMTHAIDGPNRTYSSTRKWKSAWEAEIGSKEKLRIRYIKLPSGELEHFIGKPAEEIQPGDQVYSGAGEVHTVESCEIVREGRSGNVFRVKMQGVDEVFRWDPKLAFVTTDCPKAPEAPMTRYAQGKVNEGFAEFGRLLVNDPEAARTRFPKCYKFWKDANLLE